MAMPKKLEERFSSGLKRFQPILSAAKARDVNESDTVVIITDLLHDIFGYDKYSEITSEHMIRSTFCDLAIKIDGTLALLIEAKAIGLDLKDAHVKQAVDYAANQGVDWVALTNGIIWRVYSVVFKKPIEHELVVEFDLLAMSPRKADDLELLALLSKEGWQKARLGDYHSQKQALNRFTLGAVLLSDPVLEVARREVRRLAPEVKVDIEGLRKLIQVEVLKREVLEGERAEVARKQVSKASARPLRAIRVADDKDQDKGPDEPTSAPTSTDVKAG